MTMEEDTKRELDLMWAGMREIKNDLVKEFRILKSDIASSRKWMIGLIVTAVPVWLGTFVAFWSMKK